MIFKLKEGPNFIDFIQDFDISILTEAGKTEPSKIKIEGLCNYFHVRPKHKNETRHSGKIRILDKYKKRPGLTLTEHSEVFL